MVGAHRLCTDTAVENGFACTCLCASSRALLGMDETDMDSRSTEGATERRSMQPARYQLSTEVTILSSAPQSKVVVVVMTAYGSV